MKFKASKYNNKHWKEWFNDSVTLFFGELPKGDIRLGITLGNREGTIDLFVVTFGFMRD